MGLLSRLSGWVLGVWGVDLLVSVLVFLEVTVLLLVLLLVFGDGVGEKLLGGRLGRRAHCCECVSGWLGEGKCTCEP